VFYFLWYGRVCIKHKQGCTNPWGLIWFWFIFWSAHQTIVQRFLPPPPLPVSKSRLRFPRAVSRQGSAEPSRWRPGTYREGSANPPRRGDRPDSCRGFQTTDSTCLSVFGASLEWGGYYWMEQGEEKAKLWPTTAAARGQPSAIYPTRDPSQLDSNPAANICHASPLSAEQSAGGASFCSPPASPAASLQGLLQSSKASDLWRYSSPAWTRSCAPCCRWPCFGRRVGLGDPQRSLPTPTILWFCDTSRRTGRAVCDRRQAQKEAPCATTDSSPPGPAADSTMPSQLPHHSLPGSWRRRLDRPHSSQENHDVMRNEDYGFLPSLHAAHNNNKKLFRRVLGEKKPGKLRDGEQWLWEMSQNGRGLEGTSVGHLVQPSSRDVSGQSLL